MRAFSPKLFQFLKELADNNKRDWFLANKQRYEDELRTPALSFLGRISHGMEDICPHLTADPRPNGGSLFRQHRDVRFSKDKSPYKRHLGIAIRHEAGKMSEAPGIYLHLEPRASFLAAGIFRPAKDPMRALRQGLLERGEVWDEALSDPAFRSSFALGGASLKRAPAGMDPKHERIVDLRRKDFVAICPLAQKQVVASDFEARFLDLCHASLPFQRFLGHSLGLAI